MPHWTDPGGALNIRTGAELERFDLGPVLISGKRYTVLTGYEAAPVESTRLCFWCGGVLKGKLKRYCSGHMKEYYNHFDWGYASTWAWKRAGHRCENCGIAEGDIPTIGRYYTRSGLEVHHIVPLKGASRQFTAYNLPWNLICLCHTCHVELHVVMNNHNRPSAPDTFEQALARGQLLLEGIA